MEQLTAKNWNKEVLRLASEMREIKKEINELRQKKLQVKLSWETSGIATSFSERLKIDSDLLDAERRKLELKDESAALQEIKPEKEIDYRELFFLLRRTCINAGQKDLVDVAAKAFDKS